MMKENYTDKIYVIFESTRDTILAERESKAKGLRCSAVPVPREFSPKCGIALEIPDESTEEAMKLINSSGRKFKVYKRSSDQEENH